LVDIGLNAASFERGFELAVAFARTKQDRDVCRLHSSSCARRPVPHRRRIQQTDDLIGDSFGSCLDRLADCQAEGRIGVRGLNRRRLWTWIAQRKAITVGVAKPTSLE